MGKKLEDKIQKEIQRRIFEEEEQKLQREGEVAQREALSEVTSLSREEIDRIAQSVRSEFVQKHTFFKKFVLGTVITVVVVLVIGGFMVMGQYNNMVGLDEQVKTKWGQVENVYQRRYDLIPNLVKTVQAYAEHEKELFQMVTEARAKAGGVLNISEEVLNNPETFRKFQEAQGELSQVLQRMMVVMEQYPNVKADQNFLALQAQLEGSENRIAVERKRFNEAVNQYNAYIKKFPQVVIAGMFGFKEKAYFKAEKGAENAPEVNFE
jgi:LemA protein